MPVKEIMLLWLYRNLSSSLINDRSIFPIFPTTCILAIFITNRFNLMMSWWTYAYVITLCIKNRSSTRIL